VGRASSVAMAISPIIVQGVPPGAPVLVLTSDSPLKKLQEDFDREAKLAYD